MNADVRERGKHLNLVKEEYERLEADLVRFDDLEAEAASLKELEADVEALRLRSDTFESAARIGRRLSEIDRDVSALELEVARGLEVPTIDSLEILARTLDRGNALAKRILSNDETLSSVNEALTKIPEIEAEAIERIEAKAKAYDTATEFQGRTFAWKKLYFRAVKDLESIDRELESEVQELIALIRTEKRCPVCLGPIGSDTFERLVMEFAGTAS